MNNNTTGTGGNTDTLVADDHKHKGEAADGGTYLINGGTGDDACDTINDVPDINADEDCNSVLDQPTLTAGGSDALDGAENIPDLPRDTPVQSSGGESSRENTPKMGRKKQQLSPRKKRQLNPERYLTFTKTTSPNRSGSPQHQNEAHAKPYEDSHPSDTSGYRSQDTMSSKDTQQQQQMQQPQSLNRRLSDADRFKTRTISREDIVGCNSTSPQHQAAAGTSPKTTLKQRRAEDADRYRTQTISSNTSLINLSLPGAELSGHHADIGGPMSPQVNSLFFAFSKTF